MSENCTLYSVAPCSSEYSSPEVLTPSGQRRKVWRRLSRHLFSPGEMREEPRGADSFIESSQPAVTREAPGRGLHLSSPRQVPETPGPILLNPEPEEDPSESESGTELRDLLEGLVLQRFLDVEL